MNRSKDPSVDVKVGDIIQDKHEVTGHLGQGGMAFVLAAYPGDLDRRVVLKFLLPKIPQKPQLVERFAREAIAGSKIKASTSPPSMT